MGNAVFTHGNLDFHAGVIDFAQHFNYSADCLAVTIGVVDDFNAHHLTQFGIELPFGRYQDIVTDTLVFRRHNQNAVLI